MISPEQFISDLQRENARLQSELDQAQQDIKDFEVLAIEWRKGYRDMEREYRIKLANAKQVIEQLEQELKE